STAPLRKDLALADPLRGDGHSLVDLGDDRFTRGRPHPMIDASLRNERIAVEAHDPAVLVILLDFILGYGVMDDPVGATAPAIEAARRSARLSGRNLGFVAFVCGTDADAQGYAAQVRQLQQLGVHVADSSTAAAKLALGLAGQLTHTSTGAIA
ncbi:MAG: acyl-CoA synthetase FdrA, partial [Dehalococcoidia bacterium]